MAYKKLDCKMHENINCGKSGLNSFSLVKGSWYKQDNALQVVHNKELMEAALSLSEGLKLCII